MRSCASPRSAQPGGVCRGPEGLPPLAQGDGASPKAEREPRGMNPVTNEPLPMLTHVAPLGEHDGNLMHLNICPATIYGMSERGGTYAKMLGATHFAASDVSPLKGSFPGRCRDPTARAVGWYVSPSGLGRLEAC